MCLRLYLCVGVLMLAPCVTKASRLPKVTEASRLSYLERQMRLFKSYVLARLNTLENNCGAMNNEVKELKSLLHSTSSIATDDIDSIGSTTENAVDSPSIVLANTSSVINYLTNIVDDHVKNSRDNISATLEQLNNASVESTRLLSFDMFAYLDNISSEIKTDIDIHFGGITQDSNKTLHAITSQVQDHIANETDRLEQFKTNILQDVYAICSDVQNETAKMEMKVEELIDRANEVDGIIDDIRSTLEDDIMVANWTEWTPWSQCSQTCNNGTITRDRTCLAPLSPHSTCQGKMTESQTCVTSVECPYADCSEIKQTHPRLPSAVYTITLWNTSIQVDVFCDMDTDGGGWTVFQHRVNGSVDFYRNFSSYETGFGSLNGEFWLGLSLMHEMTSRFTNELRIDIQRANGSRGYAVYPKFRIDAAPTYIIRLGNRTDDSGISIPPYLDLTSTVAYGAVGMAFSTYDRDNDINIRNCAENYHGAWWYRACYGYTNLNADYLTPGTYSINAMTFDDRLSLKTSKMMFRATYN